MTIKSFSPLATLSCLFVWFLSFLALIALASLVMRGMSLDRSTATAAVVVIAFLYTSACAIAA